MGSKKILSLLYHEKEDRFIKLPTIISFQRKRSIIIEKRSIKNLKRSDINSERAYLFSNRLNLILKRYNLIIKHSISYLNIIKQLFPL